ncbi:hypothetical protein tinsulaeT_16400 [Thalassotalea insulae]|uniref:DUF418 domain-containing protein n=1 Tax=Thalassotalea insulae TaxID=2056778 RepID=A0ABQ6GQR5_9GAMM|nr:DUF418 domain-containing protein [Thalassotalea insulae]GLX78300.1 hypothetical protein tinsulaeT_16400 [Thalassotalea insulae]
MNTTAPAPSAALQPVANKDRIQVMDLLRGFALIGIIFMNIEWFNRPISDLMAFDFSQTGGDWAASWLVKVFIEGKFYKLFSLLFGMGFAVMLLNAQQADRPFGAWFSRRMFALFLFGMVHMIFLWGGDILHDYAVAGMLLLGFVFLLRTNKLSKYNSPTAYAKTGFTIMLVPIVLSLGAAIFFGVTRDNAAVVEEGEQRVMVRQQSDEMIEAFKLTPEFLNSHLADNALPADESTEPEEEIDEDQMTTEEQIAHRVQQRFDRHKEKEIMLHKEAHLFSQADYWQVTQYRFEKGIEQLASTPMMAFVVCLPLFMIGYWLVASGRLTEPQRHKAFFNAVCWGGLGIGLVLNVVSVYIILNPITKQSLELTAISYNLFFYSQIILCFGYFGMFVKLASKQWFIRSFSWLAPLGKMALTNYISHSIILTSIFYGYAGGMFGKVDRAEQIALAIVILFCQVVICKIWLKYFRFGPLEWLWRSITYLQWQPILRREQSSERLQTA